MSAGVSMLGRIIGRRDGRAGRSGQASQPIRVPRVHPARASSDGRRLAWAGRYDTGAMASSPLIDPDVLERVLASALRRGGDMAEVFAEDRRSSSAVLDDRRVEELASGRERGAGVRVVDGDTTGYAHTADLSQAGLLAAAEVAAAVARAGGGGSRPGRTTPPGPLVARSPRFRSRTATAGGGCWSRPPMASTWRTTRSGPG